MIKSKNLRFALLFAAALAAGGCGVLKKGSGPKTPVLGQRIPVLTSESGVEVDPATQALPFNLPAPVANTAWTQPGGTATKSMGQLVLGTPLREAFAGDLPGEILTRPKASFPLPFREWIGDCAPELLRSELVRQLVSPGALELVAADAGTHWRVAWR